MMGRQNNNQGPLFYEFRLDEAFVCTENLNPHVVVVTFAKDWP